MGSKIVNLEPIKAELAQMHELFDAANRACNAGESASDFESAFVALLSYLEDHPRCMPSAELRFILGIREGTLCWELISFCMHKLRLEAVRAEVVRAIDALGGPRDAAALSHVLEAFEDAWEDAESYAFYRKGHRR
jgi:hypothetical protein